MPAMPDSLWAATAPPGPECPPLESDDAADRGRGRGRLYGGFRPRSTSPAGPAAGGGARRRRAGLGMLGPQRRAGEPGRHEDSVPDDVRRGPGSGMGRGVSSNSAIGAAISSSNSSSATASNARRCAPATCRADTAPRGVASTRNGRASGRRVGREARFLERDEVAALIGTRRYDSGCTTHRGGNVQPLAYARGLARAAISEGAVVHGASAATAISRDGAGWSVCTERASVVRCECVVLATNGYTGGLWPGLRETVVPVASFVTATAPTRPQRAAHGAARPARGVGDRADHRLLPARPARKVIIGGRGPWFEVTDRGDAPQVRAAALALFPQLEVVEWEYQWRAGRRSPGNQPAAAVRARPRRLRGSRATTVVAWRAPP